MEVNNKIRTASVDRYCGAFRNSDWPAILTQGRKTCLESPHKILPGSNGRIENYDCFREPGLLRFLCQNPNLTLLGLYHKAEPYQHEFLTSLVLKIIISAATAEQLIDQLQSFIPVIDPSTSRINWSTKESRKNIWIWAFVCKNFVSFGFIIVFYCFLYLFKCVSGLSVFAISGDVFCTLSFYLKTLRTMSHSSWRERVVVDIFL